MTFRSKLVQYIRKVERGQCQYWFKSGLIHRENGPAIIDGRGYFAEYKYGNLYKSIHCVRERVE